MYTLWPLVLSQQPLKVYKKIANLRQQFFFVCFYFYQNMMKFAKNCLNFLRSPILVNSIMNQGPIQIPLFFYFATKRNAAIFNEKGRKASLQFYKRNEGKSSKMYAYRALKPFSVQQSIIISLKNQDRKISVSKSAYYIDR